MSIAISFYSTLDEKLINKIGFSTQPLQASYLNEDNEEIEVSLEQLEGQEKTYQIIDPKVQWDPDVHNLSIYQEVNIENPGFLFGYGGLVSNNSKLGLAFRWYSKDSAQRKIYPFDTIKSEELHINTCLDVDILKGTLRGRVTFEIILYLVNAGSDIHNIVPGTVLGVLDSIDLLFDGDSSMFPIVEVKEPHKPLWWVICDFDDPMYDRFDEDNVAIVLNAAHKQSRNLKIEKGIGSSPLLLEIIASGLQIILEKVKSMGDWEQILNNESEHGSIGEAIYYFINTFNWNTSSPEKLAKSIREDFDKRFLL
ncbi:hypothetical protein [Bacillus benzoevorans]|uniref:Uncharacterized protein n=1 Tax=Bacillus benzoevorans TaxID=1456 RepID=A0A7X0HVT1_9BACI|nr:hypothetical protein [Bacillus benzoevorans]MBB6447795.1 hypothetical protein [Bacillus benzoevorans]